MIDISSRIEYPTVGFLSVVSLSWYNVFVIRLVDVIPSGLYHSQTDLHMSKCWCIPVDKSGAPLVTMDNMWK